MLDNEYPTTAKSYSLELSALAKSFSFSSFTTLLIPIDDKFCFIVLTNFIISPF